MKRFKFRLERVLHYRELIKNERKRELTEARLRLNEAENRYNELMNARSENERKAKEEGDPNQRFLAGLYAERLKGEIIESEKVVVERQLEVDKARDIYIEAAKEAEALKVLKQKRQDQYQQYIDAEEAKFLDELSIQRSFRSNSDR